MKTITIRHRGKAIAASLSEGGVSIGVDGVWAGKGKVNEQGRIDDCAAVLDDGAYEAIEEAIAAVVGEATGPVDIERIDVSGAGSVGIDLGDS